MAGDQQLHQLSIEQFVTQQDAQTEAKNGANSKFHDQLNGLEAISKGQIVPAVPIDSAKQRYSKEAGLEALASGRELPAHSTGMLDFRTDKVQNDGVGRGDGAVKRSLSEDKPSLFEEAMKESGDSIIEGLYKHWPREVTPEDRKEAKEALGKEISPLINEADSKTLKSMQEAIVDGNIGKLAETLKNMPPERAKAFIKELNKELKRNHAGVEVSATGDGRVFVHETSGQTAIQINRDGTTQLKPIRHNYDGSIVVEPGEIINKDAEEVMKGISDTAVRGITGGNRIVWEKEGPPPFFPRKPEFPIERPRIDWPKDEPPGWKNPWHDPPNWKPLPWQETKPNYELYELLKRPYWMQKEQNRDIVQF